MLEPVQQKLLASLVKAARSVTDTDRVPFMVTSQLGKRSADVGHPGLTNQSIDAYAGDLGVLEKAGLINIGHRSGPNTFEFDISPAGFRRIENPTGAGNPEQAAPRQWGKWIGTSTKAFTTSKMSRYRHQGRRVFAFTRPGDQAAQGFALELGAEWAGGSDESPREPLDAAIIFAPVGALIPTALKAVARGGTVVCAGIHMSPIPSFPYQLLWGERVVRSVANLTRQDGEEFFRLLADVPLATTTEAFPLGHANEALDRLRVGRVRERLSWFQPGHNEGLLAAADRVWAR